MALNSTTPNPVPLSTLLPPPYQLVYSVPLLVLSIPVAFSGAFLTLDRTRQFTPRTIGGMTPATSSSKSSKWRFEGGLGGLLGGYLSGVHISTLLALLIINRTPSPALGPLPFLFVYLLSGVLLSVLSSRFKYIALPLIGLSGGAAFSLFVTIACHPSKFARIILLAVFSITCSIICTLPMPKTQHSALRFATGWLGALGLVLSISILANIPSYTDIWARLWVPWDVAWGGGKEKGLTAGFILFALAGIGTDFLLHWKLGENPDAKWDSYLASYAANLPNSHDRPGVFEPSVPIWKRLFNPTVSSDASKAPILFPPDKALLSKTMMAPGAGKGLSPPPYRGGKLLSQSRKSSKEAAFKGTSFQPLSSPVYGDSSDSDGSDGEEGERYIPRPWAKRRQAGESLDGVTLADFGGDGKTAGEKKTKSVDGELMYSDGESASPSMRKGARVRRDMKGWTPEFLKRHSTNQSLATTSASQDKAKAEGKPVLSPPATSQVSDTRSPPPAFPVAPAGAVPMTPSLLKALDRVSKAQNEAYGKEAYAGIVSKGHTPQATNVGDDKVPTKANENKEQGTDGESNDGIKMPAPPSGYDWGKFWKGVEDKAKEDGPHGR